MRRVLTMLAGVALVAAACGGDDDADTTTAAPTTAATGTTAAPEAEGPPTAPSEIVAEAQTSDGTTITVIRVSLPSPGFIAVHSNADGGPGPVIGHSDLLEAGTSGDVTVTLDEPLTSSDTVFPMVHIDFDEDGVYEFFPPDETVDIPGVTADGEVAVVGAEVTVEDGAAAPPPASGSTGIDY